jgi:pterin-4a-carbinolamine dehydratase
MTNETGQDVLQQEIEELVARGWKADTATCGLTLHRDFPSFSETLNYLMEVGAEAERFGTAPSIHVDGDNDVAVRVGSEPPPPLTAAEIGFARALAA